MSISEGYGEDRQNTLEAFPFSQQLPSPNTHPANEDVELRKKLKNMSRGMFSLLTYLGCPRSNLFRYEEMKLEI